MEKLKIIFMKQALLFKTLKNDTVQCQACNHYCVIENETRGKCGARENKAGTLYSAVYGFPCALHIDPIEKKPFFHFLPGSQSLSLATVGCNLACYNCQNWSISQGPKINPDDFAAGKIILPEEIIIMAQQNKTPSISYTYTEPTIFVEYALDIMRLAKKTGIKNAWVSNGFFSVETFDLVRPFLDAANIDLKSFDDGFYQRYCGGRLQPILDNLKRIKQVGVWLEITTLVIPSLSDGEENFKKMADFIKKELGEETPWHISQFSGAISWKLRDLPETPPDTLKKAYEIGRKAGLKYVYTGNIAGLDSEDTYCPKCHAKMVNRSGYFITRADNQGKCAKCGTDLKFILQ